MKGKKGILFAADIPNKKLLFSILEEVKTHISAVKIGNLILYAYSWEIIKEIKKIIDIPLIADIKLLDMPNMAGRITRDAINYGVDGIMVAGSIGVEGILSCKENLDNKLLFIFTQFTHCDGLISENEADKYIELAFDLNCDGFQVPATAKGRIKNVRKRFGNDKIIISCGIGTQKFYGNNTEGPPIGSAIKEGADYEIIGRSIYQDPSPQKAAKNASEIISQIIKNI